MKKMLFVIGIVLTQMLNAQQIFAPQIKWQITQNRNSRTIGIVESNNGHYVSAGQDSIFFLEEFDSTGYVYWQKNLDLFNATSFGGIASLLKASDGYVVTWTACSMPGGHRSIRILKTDFGGNILWDKYYGDTLHQYYSYSAELALNGEYIVSGIEELWDSTGIHQKSFLMCIDTSGGITWYKAHTFGGYGDYPLAMVSLNNGFGELIQSNLFSFPYVSFHFLKMDSQGDSVSIINFQNHTAIRSLAKSNLDGSLLFSASHWDTIPSPTTVMTTMKFNQNGTPLTQKSIIFPSNYWEFLESIKPKIDSGFIQVVNLSTDTCLVDTGYCYSPVFLFTKIIRLSENGDTLWTKKIGGTKGHSLGISSFTLTHDGGIALLGYECDSAYYTNNNGRVIIIKLGLDSLFCSLSTANQITSDTIHIVSSLVNNYVLVNVDTILNNIITKTDSVFILTKKLTTQIMHDSIVTRTNNCTGLVSITNYSDTTYLHSSIIDTTVHHYVDTVKLIITSVKEVGAFKCNIYPNPTSGQLILQLKNCIEKDEINFSLYDETGKLIKYEKIQTEQTIFSLNNLSDGRYFFNVSKSNEIIKSGKVILVK